MDTRFKSKIIYWNMRNTAEFPTVTYTNNITVITNKIKNIFLKNFIK